MNHCVYNDNGDNNITMVRIYSVCYLPDIMLSTFLSLFHFILKLFYMMVSSIISTLQMRKQY